MAKNRYTAAPIMERYEIDEMTGCWNWLGARNKFGYGMVAFGQHRTGDRVRIVAHRYFYEQIVGPIPDGKVLCHSCDNPSCVNPDHLWPGTQSENVKDCLAKGRADPIARALKGERNHFSKLAEDQVRAIRQMTGAAAEIAPQFGVKPGIIWAIRAGRAWTHVT